MTTWFGIQRQINDFNHVFILLTGVFMTLFAFHLDFQDTAKHLFLTIVGFHVLIAEALMSHYPINRITNRFSYRGRSRYHGTLQLIGGVMVLLGVFDKIQITEKHFTTWHGISGLFTALMCFVSLIGGILNFFQPKFIHKILTPSQLKFRHNLFGLLTFSLGMFTIYLGYFTEFFKKYFSYHEALCFSRLTILVFLLTTLPPLCSLWYKWTYWR